MKYDFVAGAKRLGIDLDKLGLTAKPKLLEDQTESAVKASEYESSSSLAQVLLGPVELIGEFYFPTELIGGCCPRVIGDERDIVWNAAAEATDSERVRVVWQAQGDKIWYLAVRSSELGSHPNTWCPFASLLPGMKDSVPPPACYTYISDEAATMMTILADGLQIHRGTASVIRAKAERMARELGDAPLIDLISERIEKLTPTPWLSMSLFEDQARRILASFSVISAIAFTAVAVVVWFLVTVAMLSAHTDLKDIKTRTEEKSLRLMNSVQALRASPMRAQLAKFSDLNDGLLALNGWLEVYQIKDGKPLWRATLPINVTSDRINELGGQTLDNTPQGVVVGNSRDALNLGATATGRRK